MLPSLSWSSGQWVAGVERIAPTQHPDDLLRRRAAKLRDGVVGGKGDVRCHRHGGCRPKTVGHIGFSVEDIECRRIEVPAVDRVDQRSSVDESASPDIDQKPSRFHPRELRARDQVPGLGRQRRVEHDDVGPLEQFGETHEFGPVELSRSSRPGHEDPGAEGTQLPRGLPADPSVADDPAGERRKPAQTS